MRKERIIEPKPHEPRQKCFLCGEETGRCAEDSILAENGDGEFCEYCWEETACNSCDATGIVYVWRNSAGKVDYLDGSPTNEQTNCSLCHGKGYRV